MMKKLLNHIVCAACVAIMSAGGALSADFTWTGSVDNTSWKNAGNWEGGNVGLIEGGYYCSYQGRLIVATGGNVVWDIEGHDSKSATIHGDEVLRIDNGTNLTINAIDQIGNFYGSIFVGRGSSLIFSVANPSDVNFAAMSAELWNLDGYVSVSGGGAAGPEMIRALKLNSYGELHFTNRLGGRPQEIGAVSAVLDVTLSLTGVPLQKSTRTLVTGLSDDAVIDSFAFTSLDGGSMNEVSSADEVKNAGDYFVYRDGGSVKVDYMGAKAVPEPAMASLALVAFSGLLLRRRLN